MSGTEYDLVHRETLKIHAVLGALKEQGFRTGDIGSVFVFFMTPPKGDA